MIPFDLLEETPREDDERLDRQARVIIKRIEHLSGVTGGRRLVVLGIEGERGMGKTSLLLALNRFVGRPEQKGKWRVAEPALFEPSRSSSDDLIADLIEHLYGSTRDSNVMAKRRDSLSDDPNDSHREIFVELARKAWPKKFVEIACDEAPSVDELPARLGEELVAQARRDSRLAWALSQQFDTLASSPESKVLVLVDDFDLAPNKVILGFFDLVHRYLDHRRGECTVVLAVAYDHKSLLHALANVPRKKRPYDPGALLAKHIPYTWPVMPIEPAARFDWLWYGDPDDSTGVGPLQWFWPHDPEVVARLSEALGEDRTPGTFEDRDRMNAPIQEDAPDGDPSPRDLAAQMISGRLVPQTPRLTKRLYNDLILFIWQALANSQSGADERTKLQQYAEALLSSTMDARSRHHGPFIGRDAVLPFISLVLALDLAEPEHRLAHRLRTDPDGLFDWLRAIEIRQDISPNLRRLVTAWSAWASVRTTGKSGPRLIALSVNADALAAVPDLVDRTLADNIVHLDLRSVVGSSRPPPERIALALEALAQRAKATGLADLRSPLDVIPIGPVSLVCWLGWYLRHVRSVTAYNLFRNAATPFDGPIDPLRPKSSGGVLDVGMPGPASSASEEAIVTAERTSAEDIGRADGRVFVFVDLLPRPVPVPWSGADRSASAPPAWRIHVRMTAERAFVPDDLEPALQAVLDQFGQLRDEGIKRFDLAMRVPAVFAFFLGHNLHPGLGEIRLLEPDAQYAYHAVGRLDDPPT